MKWLLCLTTIAFLSALSFAEPRQWDVGGVAVRHTYDVRWHGESATNSDGVTLYVWTDTRSGSNSIYGQLVAADGTAMWQEDGQLLARSLDIGTYHPSASFSQDGWIVSWMEMADDGAPISRVRAMKFSNEGLPLWNHPDQTGLIVAEGAQSSVFDEGVGCTPDLQGGAYIHWITYQVTHVQRITSDGNMDWTTPTVIGTTGAFIWPDFQSDGAGNLIAAWTQNTDIYCTKVDPTGDYVWPNPLIVCDEGHSQIGAIAASDGAGGVFITWEDWRDFNPDGGDFYCQRISSGGVPLWQANGIPVITTQADRGFNHIAISKANGSLDGLLVSWSEQRAGARRAVAQKLSLTGQRQWTDAGIEFCPRPVEQDEHLVKNLFSDLAGGAIVSWEIYPAGSSERRAALARIGSDGLPVWPSCAVEFTQDFPLDVSNVTSVTDPAIMAAWSVRDQDFGRIRTQKFDMSTGQSMMDPLSLCDFIDSWPNDPSICALASGRTAVAWQDYRHSKSELYFQISLNDGAPTRAFNGQKLIEPPNPASFVLENPQMCSDGVGGFYCIYTSSEDNFRRLRLTRRNAQGNRVGSTTGVLLQSGNVAEVSHSRLIKNSDNSVFVVWSEFDATFQQDIYIARYTTLVQPSWNGARRITSNLLFDDDLVDIVNCANNSCIIFYRTGEFGSYYYRAARVSSGGDVLWDVAVTDENNSAGHLFVSSYLDSSAAIGWDIGSQGDGEGVFIQQLNPDGTLRWQIEGARISPEDVTSGVAALKTDAPGNFFVAYTLTDQVSVDDIYLQKLSPDGDPLWGAQGRFISSESDLSEEFNGLTVLDDENVYVLWSSQSPTGLAPLTIHMTHLDGNGNSAPDAFWQNGAGNVLCDRISNQRRPQMVTDSQDGVVVLWEDEPLYGHGSTLFIQRVFDPIITGVDESPVLPTEFSLSQNYPNPFNPSTTIEFYLPVSSEATLKIYDVTGRQVATMLDGPTTAGIHRVTIEASNLPSGVYFYNFRADHHSQTRKMVLLK
jgi:hypothetical protein